MLRVVLPLFGLPLAGAATTSEPTREPGSLGEPPPGLALLRWQWHEVEAPYLVALWILVASLAKIGECVCASAGGRRRTCPQPLLPRPELASCTVPALRLRFHNPGSSHSSCAASCGSPSSPSPRMGSLRICLLHGLPQLSPALSLDPFALSAPSPPCSKPYRLTSPPPIPSLPETSVSGEDVWGH